jgi:hypothetical protein
MCTIRFSLPVCGQQAMEVLTFSVVKPAPAPRGKLGWAYSMCERVRPALQAIDKYLKTRTKEMYVAHCFTVSDASRRYSTMADW